MSRPMMSAAAGALLRALLQRAGADQSRILLTDITTTEWHSLTFAGERHVAGFTVRGSGAMSVAQQWTDRIEDADLPIRGSRFVAEIKVSVPPFLREDGSVFLQLEALTLDA